MVRIRVAAAAAALLLLAVAQVPHGAAQESGTIVDLAAANEDFSTLVAAIQQAGLVDTLSGPGPFTVFAPTNEAFESFLQETGMTAEQLLAADNLATYLTYHVIPDAVRAPQHALAARNCHESP